MDWLNWEERLKEMAQDKTEATWPDPNLQRAEDQLLSNATDQAEQWIAGVWTLAKRVLSNPTKKNYQTFAKEADVFSYNTDITDKVVRIAKRRVQHINSLPKKGPDIEVPPPLNEEPHKESVEWAAEQSAGNRMKNWAYGMREDVKWQVLQALREGISADELAKRLEARWDKYGQDFQLIAVTEMNIAYNDACLNEWSGKHVVIPTIGDDKVCHDCKKLLEGKVFYVSPAIILNPTKLQAHQYLWIGKSNVGRKKSDWWPCLPLHPRCRHIVVLYRGGDPDSYKAKG